MAVNRAVDRFDPASGNGTFRGWLWVITRSKVRDHWRLTSGREIAAGGTKAQLHLASLPDTFTECTDDPSDSAEITSLFHRALGMIQAEFEPRTWEAFWRSAVQQHDTARVAEELGMSAGAVRQAKSRVLRRLRKELGDL